jgi:hypothetical protein
MPAKSVAQRRLFAIAEHHPEKLNPVNRGLLKMKKSQLHDFAATPEKGLPKYQSSMAMGAAKKMRVK